MEKIVTILAISVSIANNEENKDNQFDFIKNIKYWIGYTRYKNFSKEGKKCTQLKNL
jgi:hypothetical protein